MGKLDEKVALVTGAARGQGRAHAIRLAEEGADIIAVDIADQITSAPYAMASRVDLEATVKAVESLGRQIISCIADIRDAAALSAAVATGVAQLGGLDIVIANAGIQPMALNEHEDAWRDAVDVNLTGTFNTVEATKPALIERGGGPSY
jgi:NAD(P)-dependent dehydrogenase (short-subunit alcohol dehydrogenase family)